MQAAPLCGRRSNSWTTASVLRKRTRPHRTDTSSMNFSIPTLNTGREADSFEA